MIAMLESTPAGAQFNQTFLRSFSNHHLSALSPSLSCQVKSDISHGELLRYCEDIVVTQKNAQDDDPKPDAISAYRGDFGHIPTTIPGIHFSEHLPLLARRAHKFSLIRSAYVNSPSHPVAIYQTLTGWDLPGASVESKNRNVLHPSIGSVIARQFWDRAPLLPS